MKQVTTQTLVWGCVLTTLVTAGSEEHLKVMLAILPPFKLSNSSSIKTQLGKKVFTFSTMEKTRLIKKW